MLLGTSCTSVCLNICFFQFFWVHTLCSPCYSLLSFKEKTPYDFFLTSHALINISQKEKLFWARLRRDLSDRLRNGSFIQMVIGGQGRCLSKRVTRSELGLSPGQSGPPVGEEGSKPLSSRFLSPGLLALLGALKAGLRAAAESQGAPHSSGLAATLLPP